jgi:RNA polymerase sigma factor (TIGR02999 family)
VADEVTALVEAAADGNEVALKALFARVYEELKVLARRQLESAAGATLNTTGLVHEAYLRIVQPDGQPLHNRVHFFALAAKAMRHIVIDGARARVAEKRGGEHLDVVPLDEALDVVDDVMNPDDLLRLDAALTRLAASDARLGELVELRFFAGLEIAEIAALRDVSERTLNRDWRRAKAHLHASLYPDA